MIDRVKLGGEVIEWLRSNERPIRLSAKFLVLWCGQEQPTAEIIAELAAAGFSIEIAGDYFGGWEIRPQGHVDYGRLF